MKKVLKRKNRLYKKYISNGMQDLIYAGNQQLDMGVAQRCHCSKIASYGTDDSGKAVNVCPRTTRRNFQSFERVA